MQPNKSFREQVGSLADDEKTNRQIDALHYERARSAVADELAYVLDEEQIRTLHVEEIPVGHQALCHALADEDEERRIRAPVALKERRCSRRIYSRKKHGGQKTCQI